MHVPELGCPKLIRDQYRVDANWKRYKEGFLRYLDQQNDVISEMAAMASTTTCALLCFEADYNYCHRSMVANAIKNVRDMPVFHLQVNAIKKAIAETRHLNFA
jgi:uncharacterized protein (DUF488 family)